MPNMSMVQKSNGTVILTESEKNMTQAVISNKQKKEVNDAKVSPVKTNNDSVVPLMVKQLEKVQKTYQEVLTMDGRAVAGESGAVTANASAAAIVKAVDDKEAVVVEKEALKQIQESLPTQQQSTPETSTQSEEGLSPSSPEIDKLKEELAI